MTNRQQRIADLTASIIAASIEATRDWRAMTPRGIAMVKAHNAINHRTTLNKYPHVAAYWSGRR